MHASLFTNERRVSLNSTSHPKDCAKTRLSDICSSRRDRDSARYQAWRMYKLIPCLRCMAQHFLKLKSENPIDTRFQIFQIGSGSLRLKSSSRDLFCFASCVSHQTHPHQTHNESAAFIFNIFSFLKMKRSVFWRLG